MIGVLAVGPAVMRLLFGSEFDYDRARPRDGRPPAWACTCRRPRVNQAVLAQGRARLAAACWAVTAVFFVAFLLLAGMEEVREVEVAFLASAGMLSVLLYLVYRRPVAGAAPIRPGSTEEMGVILAAADEGS